MRSFILSAIAAVIAYHIKTIDAQTCDTEGAQELKGNWYCSEVKAITYQNFPGNGSYNKVMGMNEVTGQCDTVKYEYYGSPAPLNEELSLHFRGPIWLKQVAVYTPTPESISGRSLKHSKHGHRHEAHGYIHGHHGQVREVTKRELEKRSVGQLISATIDGQLVSWTNEYAGPGVSTNLPSTIVVQPDEANVSSALSTSNTEMTPEEIVTSLSTIKETIFIPPQVSTTASSSSKSAKISPATMSTPEPMKNGGWTRQAYYDASSGTAQGLTFLNHFGGTVGIPGTAAGGPAKANFGASLSYASNDGKSGAKSPQVLSDAAVDDNVEVIIMSNKSCDDGGCGYVRPGGVNYYGFEGSQKVMLFEFMMPATGKKGFNEDMPAIWALNAQIARISQYGTNPDCSCWTSGCGEFDLFEILDSGNFRCKSTLHVDPAGGSSNWFQRPVGSSMTAALIIGGMEEVAAIRVLDQDQSFSEQLDKGTVDGWLGMESSVFKMAD
ncbi:target of Sbf [Lecanora helva]